MNMITDYTYEEYLEKIQSFHGHLAPGLIIGGFMVDLAMKNLPPGEFFDVICETGNCLPDAVQLLTPCTVGNGWLKIIDVGRFALSFYDKYSGKGVRVYIDRERLAAWPAIYEWFMKLKPKKEQDSSALFGQIKEAGSSILGMSPLLIKRDFLGKKSSGPVGPCPSCGEPYPLNQGGICGGCSGRLPYAEE